MNKSEILEKLKDDEHYYGDFGKQFLSNSDIGALLNNPRQFQKREPGLHASYLVGGYFHTAILEPHKLGNFKIVNASTRNTKVYKDLGEHALLQKEVDNIHEMKAVLERCDEVRNLVYPLLDKDSIEYEVPAITEIEGVQWKGKADILNHEEKLIVDLKTTGDILKFRSSAFKYNYDSQAFIYKELFGYDLVFVAIDKTTHQLGLFECSDYFYDSGRRKVDTAVEIYKQWQAKDFDPEQAFIYETL